MLRGVGGQAGRPTPPSCGSARDLHSHLTNDNRQKTHHCAAAPRKIRDCQKQPCLVHIRYSLLEPIFKTPSKPGRRWANRTPPYGTPNHGRMGHRLDSNQGL